MLCTHCYATGKPYPEVLDLVTPPPWMLPLLLDVCHSSSMSPLLLDATPPRCCHSSSMLSFLLQCFHSSYYAGAISTILLILLQYCCSSFNIAAPPSMLLLHLHVAIPPSTLTLNQCCHSFDGLMFLLLPNINAPPSLLLPILECCLNLQFPSKNESFFIAGPSNWSLSKE